MAKILKEKITFTLDDSVAANSSDTKLSPIIPEGKIVKILVFGGYDPSINDGIGSIISLQYGNAGNWITLRACGNGTFEFKWQNGFDVTGDGTKRFRIVRQNKSAIAKTIIAWFDACVIN